MSIIITAKDPEKYSNILTLNAFREMVEFEEALYNVTINDDGYYTDGTGSYINYGGGEGSKQI